MASDSRKTDQLKELRAERDKLKSQLRAVKESFSYRLGNMLVEAVARPGRNTVLMPYRLASLCITGFRKRRKQVHTDDSRRFCPVCEKWSPYFRKSGVVPRYGAKCPYCSAVERHRFFWLFVSRRTNLFDGKPKRMLHVAPEPAFERRFKELLGDDYLTADLSNPRAMVKMDVTNIGCPTETFDVIYCSHVLEHVEDDRKAMRELFRVLKKDGWAILEVPIMADRTYEDPTITDPEDRLKVFGQHDHVRRYGPDYVDRLREAGFTVTVIKVTDMLSDKDAVTMGLSSKKRVLHYCTKQQMAATISGSRQYRRQWVS